MTRSRSQTTTRRLALEPLDRRDLPSGSGTGIPWGITLNSYGVLHVKGAGLDDVATVTVEDGQVHAILKHWTAPTPEIPTGVLVGDQDKVFPVAKVKSISFYGLDGDDQFTNDTGRKSTAFGSAGDDTLSGGSGADVLAGGDGVDTLEGRRGSDALRGGPGSDRYLFAPHTGTFIGPAGLGSDTITEAANLDADRLDFSALAGGVKVFLGTTYPQTVKSGYLTLTLSDALGVENVTGTPGADTIYGNNRPNTVVGLDGNDTMLGSYGADVLSGGPGVDSLAGGAGNDIVWGGDDPDQLAGSDGNDQLFGDGGNDTVNGGPGADVLWGGDGNDFLDGWSGGDSLHGGAGNDKLWATTDKFWGDTGNDLLSGDGGDDMLEGGGGQDTMDGGAGFDDLRAGNGVATLSNGERVKIAVPSDTPGIGVPWILGAEAASRFLRSCGFWTATQSAVSDDAQGATVISSYGGVGLPPPVVQDIMQEYKADIHRVSGASFQSVLDRLAEGRPVIALLGEGEVEVEVPYPWDPDNTDTAPAALYYVCVTGFDLSSDTIFYTQPNGYAKSVSFSEFQQKWNWAADGAVYDYLSDRGVKKRTMIW
jgi:RTX calcium-binding nonapeptide repeat (4 copies)